MEVSRNKTNFGLRNNFFQEIIQDSNYFKKTNYNEYSREKLSNQTISNYSNDEYKINFTEFINKDIQPNNFKTIYNSQKNIFEDINQNKNKQKNLIDDANHYNNAYLIIYEEIKSNIEKFMLDNNNDKISINLVLKEILNATIIIIKDFFDKKLNSTSIDNNNKNILIIKDKDKKEQSEINQNFELNINSKIVFLLKIEKLENKIKSLQKELDFFKNIINFHKKSKYKQNFVNSFKKKYLEQKSKNKKSELKYLFFIGEQVKKINSLENELKKKEKENLSDNEIKSIRCFPYFHQYNFKEDINPKSIPLHKQFQKDNIINSQNNASIPNKKNVINNNRSKLCFKNKNSEKNLYFKNNKEDKITKFKNKNYNISKNNIKSKYTISEKNIFNNSIIKNIKKDLNPKLNTIDNNEENKLHEFIKDYHPKTILDNKKEFFISHPNLSIAGIAKKKEIKYAGLPKKLIRFKVHKSLEKNMMFTFPSSLNETLVNLEKLRKYKI